MSNTYVNTISKLQKVALALLFVFACIPTYSSAITVGPVKLEYTADPGTTIEGEMFIKNEETVEKTFYPSVDGFTEQNGEKVFNNDGLIQDWFSTNQSVTLKPGDGVKVPYTIQVPADAPAGGQFAVVWWGTTPKNATSTEGSQSVSIQTRAGILVYINVNGDVVEKAEVTHLFKDIKDRFFFGRTVSFPYSINNTGTVYIKPKGAITVTSIFGSEVANLPINQKGFQILPNSYRDFGDSVWKTELTSIGVYKVNFKLEYGLKNTVYEKTNWIVVLPIKTISVIVLGLLVLWFFFRSYNKWLVSRYVHTHEDNQNTHTQ
jgi:hypothetical protein